MVHRSLAASQAYRQIRDEARLGEFIRRPEQSHGLLFESAVRRLVAVEHGVRELEQIVHVG